MNSIQYQFIKNISDFLVVRFNFSRDVAKFIGCQFALESEYGNSRIAKINHNYCGMKVVKTRITTQLRDEYNGFGVYFTMSDCIVDFVLRMQYFKPSPDEYQKISAYKKFNERTCYCPELDYNNRINNIYQQFKNYQNGKTS